MNPRCPDELLGVRHLIGTGLLRERWGEDACCGGGRVKAYRQNFYNMRANIAERDSNGNPNWGAWERNQKAKLRNWLQRSSAQWKFVVGHHPIWSASKAHGNTYELQGDNGIEVRACGGWSFGSRLTTPRRAAPSESRMRRLPRKAGKNTRVCNVASPKTTRMTSRPQRCRVGCSPQGLRNATRRWDAQGLLKQYNVAAYFNGHDHNLQHIKRADSPVQYIISGAGSAVRADVHDNWPKDGSLKRLCVGTEGGLWVGIG